MKAKTKELTGRQWAAIVILSYCNASALSMRFVMPDLLAEQQVNALTEIVWNLRYSLSGTSVNSTLLFGSLMGLGVLAHRMRDETCPPRTLLPVSFLIALVWLMGTSFRINNTLEALDSSPGQIVKSVCYVLGSTYLLYELGQLLFYALEKKSTERVEVRGKLARMYQRHPFGLSFFAILLFWLPHLIIAYPGYMCWDAWFQLTQFFGKNTFTTHHPPVHTVFLGALVQLGLRLGSGNIGLYISIVVQSLIAVSVLAYMLSLMKKWSSPQWLRIVAFAVIVFVPYYTNYAALVIKDTLYTIWFLLFVMEIMCMLEKGIDYFINRKHILLLAVSIMGTILFRNNGKYVLYPVILVLLVYFWVIGRKRQKKECVKPVICLLTPILAANLLSAGIIGHYDIEKGSIKEALSLPFQQTARYVLERDDEVTDEEAEAIRAVLDYDHLAEKYDPRISDPVKGTYKNTATAKELLQYFMVWVKMSFKHPEIYIKATMNQNYYLLYPFVENNTIYTDTLPEDAPFVKPVNGELGISEMEALQTPKDIMRGFYNSSFSLPVIGMLSNQAVYCILLIFLIVFAISKKLWHLMVAAFPVVLSAGIAVLAPAIQGHPRYAFPIIYAMPVILAYYIYLERPDIKR